MKIDLYAKKVNSKGHVKIGTVDVPDNIGYQYRMPIKQPIDVISASDGNLTTNTILTPVRVFNYKPSILSHALKLGNKMYLEE